MEKSTVGVKNRMVDARNGWIVSKSGGWSENEWLLKGRWQLSKIGATKGIPMIDSR